MADGDADNRSDVTGGGPVEGTTPPADDVAAQGAGGGTPAAPAEGTTDDDVIQVGQSAEPKAKGGAGDDEVAKLRERSAYLQAAHDEKSQEMKAVQQGMKAVQELHPEYFDADGKFVGTQQAKSEEGVIQVGGARQKPPAQPVPAQRPAPIDPQTAYRNELNAQALFTLYEGEDLYGALDSILDLALADRGLTPEFLQQRGGGPGMTQEQLAQLVDQRASQQIAQHEREVAAFENSVAVINAQFAPLSTGRPFLEHKIKFADSPQMTLKQALPRIMQETGTRDPIAAILSHNAAGPVARKALVRSEAIAMANQMIREQGGEQIMPGGGGLPGAGNVLNDLESIGASTERPVR